MYSFNRADVNIRELAQLAGVSKTTVAYALKNSPRVHPNTCQRIQDLARQHGYHTNPAVRSFMREVRQGRIGRGHHTLGFVSSLDSDGHPRRHRHGNESELIRGAQAEAKALGCDLDIIDWSLEAAPQLRLSQILKARGIQGVFLGPATAPHTKMDLPWSDIAVLSSGYTVEEPPMDRTACDLFSAVLNAGERAMSRGYNPVIIAMDDYSNERVGWRWLSAATTLRELHGDRIRILRGRVPAMAAQIQTM